MSLLEARGLSKRFGGVQAVAALDLDVGEGEVVGLIGPNGAGKTTAFDLLSGFLAADAGEIRFRGRPVRGLKPHAICALGLARTFQIVRPFPRLSVLDNVLVGALARHVGERLVHGRSLGDRRGRPGPARHGLATPQRIRPRNRSLRRSCLYAVSAEPLRGSTRRQSSVWPSTPWVPMSTFVYRTPTTRVQRV